MVAPSLLGARPSVSERVAAGVAVASLIGAVLVLVVGVATSWRGIAVAVVGLLVAVIYAWRALGRRGAPRLVAAGIGLAGVALLITGLLLTGMQGFRMALAATLAVASVASARVALRRSPAAMRRAARFHGPVAPARHPVLFINAKAGGARAERHQLVEACQARGIEPIVLGPDDDLGALAERVIARGADVIGMAGGDGSQGPVVTAAISHDIPYVVVPAGTRNHFALDLGLDRDDVIGALDAFQDGVERRVDVGVVNGRIFVNNVSAGLYAQVVQSPGYRRSKARTVIDVLPELIGPDAEPMHLRFTGPDGTAFDTAHVVLVSNDPYELHGLSGRGTRERLDLGVLGIAAIWIASASEVGRYLALEATGRGSRFPGLVEWSSPRFRIDAAAPIQVGIDGEAALLDPPLLFESRPLSLRVRLPRHAIGQSPKARAVQLLSRTTVTQLLRIIGGRPPSPR